MRARSTSDRTGATYMAPRGDKSKRAAYVMLGARLAAHMAASCSGKPVFVSYLSGAGAGSDPKR
jgi:hypothetical protein